MVSYPEFIDECDQALRAGRGGEVVRRLRTLVPSKVPREFRLPLARLSRRCEQFIFGLKLLTPVVYPEKSGADEPPTGGELAEFAALRMKIGSIDEALQILSRIDGSQVLEAPLLRAFCHMARWDYAPAVADLKNYLSFGPEAYPALIAKVNLAASLISIEAFDEALPLLGELIAATAVGNYQRLRANCLELRSQIYLARNEDSSCRKDLEAASKILTSQKTIDQLYIHKWLAVLDSRKSNHKKHCWLFKKKLLKGTVGKMSAKLTFNCSKSNLINRDLSI